MIRCLSLALMAAGLAASAAAECAVTATTITTPFVPPPPYRSANAPRILYGTEDLWTEIAPSYWTAQGRNLSAKLVFWRVGFDWKQEPLPLLSVKAQRLDSPAPVIWMPTAHAVKLREDDSPAGMAMMTGITFPTPGCWEISANYRGKMLSYVVAVN